MNEENNITIDNNIIEKNKKSKKNFIIGAVIVLIVLGVLLYIGYKKLNSNPVAIYQNAITDTYNYLSKNLKESEKNSLNYNGNDPLNLNINAKLDSNIEELKNFNGYDYGLKIGYDPKKEMLNMGLDISKDKQKIISAIYALINNKAYLKSDELFNKVINLGDIDLDEYADISMNNVDFSYDELDYVLKSLKNIINDSFDKSKFKVDNDKLTIDNKEYNVKKIVYKMDAKNMERTSQFIIDNMLKDQKLIEIFSKLSGVSTSDIEKGLKDALKDINFSNFKTIDIILYTTKLNEIIAGSMVEDNIEYVKFTNVNKNLNIIFTDNKDEIIINSKDDLTTIKCNNGNTELFSIDIKNSKDSIKIDFLLNYEGKFIGTLELKNMKSSKDKTTGDFILSFKTSIFGEEMDFKIDGSYSVLKGEVESLDTTNSVDINTLSESEIMGIYSKLGSILERFGLSDLL